MVADETVATQPNAYLIKIIINTLFCSNNIIGTCMKFSVIGIKNDLTVYTSTRYIVICILNKVGPKTEPCGNSMGDLSLFRLNSIAADILRSLR